MEADLILVKDFPEADPEARMKVHMVYKDVITGKMSKRVRKRAPSRLTLWTLGLHPVGETARRAPPGGDSMERNGKFPSHMQSG